MPVSAETVEEFEARFETLLAQNPHIAALDDAAIMDAMPPVGAISNVVMSIDFQLPY